MKAKRFLIPCLIVLALFLASCVQTAIPETGTGEVSLTIEVTDSNLTVPEGATPGLVTFNLGNNANTGTHEIVVARLNTGVTLEQFMEQFRQDDMAAVQLVALIGGLEVTPGTQDNFQAVLQEGSHVVIAFANEQEDTPPKVGSFQVSGAAREPVDLPQADVTVNMVDFSFAMPETLPAGESMWEFTNTGSQWHHMVLVRPSEGVTQEQILEMIERDEEPQGPPPFEEVGYFGPQTQGERAWITLDLEPGTYIAICFLPDFTSGEAHAVKGMIKTITVGQ